MLTDVAGVLDKSGELMQELTIADCKALQEDGTLSGGMIPKIRACLNALEAGVGKTHILDGRLPHSLLLEILTDKGIGTLIS